MKRLAAVLFFFVLLSMLALYLPVLRMATHLPGTPRDPVTDFFHFHWNYWWMRHALTTPDLHVYTTDYVLAPYESSLAYHTLTPCWFPLWALLEPLAGTIPAMTAIFILSMTLAGAAFFGLLRREGVSGGLALVGGSMLALSPMMFNGVFWTNINLMGWFWLPVLILLWDQLVRADHAAIRTGWALLVGLACWGMVLTDLQYPLFALFVAAPYGALTLWRAPDWASRGRLVAWGSAALALAVILLWIVGPLPYLLDYDRSGLAPTPAERAVSIRFPEGYVGQVDAVHFPVSLGAVLLPLVAVALAVNWRWRTRAVGFPAQRWFWLGIALPPLVLSAGATITLAGIDVPLPYRALHALMGGMFRYPERFAPVLLIPAAIFALQTLTPVLAGHPRARWLVPAGLLALVIVDSGMLRPFPMQPIPAYSFYETMGRDPYDYVVVEVPTGASTGEGLVGEAIYASTQFFGITHGKRMINGHISRVDTMHYWHLRTGDPLLSWLGQRQLLDPTAAEPRLREIIDDYPVGYFVVHTDWIDHYTGHSTTQEVLGYLNSLPEYLCPVYVEGPAVAYRTTWHPAGCPPRTPPQDAPGVYRLDVGRSGDEGFLGWGWHWPEEIVPGLTARWTGQLPTAEVFVHLPPGAYTLTINAQSFQQPRDLRVYAGGALLATVTVPAAHLTPLAIPLPADFTGRFVTLTLDYDAPAPVEGTTGRPLALLVDWLRFAPTNQAAKD